MTNWQSFVFLNASFFISMCQVSKKFSLEVVMVEPASTKNIGLRGVKVADTKISHVDGENGILIYRGYRIEDLARNSTFEETAYLLLHDALPSPSQLEEFTRQLVRARQIPTFLLNALKDLPHGAHPMDVLQA